MKLRPQPWNGFFWQRLPSEYQDLWRKYILILLVLPFYQDVWSKYNLIFLASFVSKDLWLQYIQTSSASFFWEENRGLFVVVKWPLESLPLCWEIWQPALFYASFILTLSLHYLTLLLHYLYKMAAFIILCIVCPYNQATSSPLTYDPNDICVQRKQKQSFAFRRHGRAYLHVFMLTCGVGPTRQHQNSSLDPLENYCWILFLFHIIKSPIERR